MLNNVDIGVNIDLNHPEFYLMKKKDTNKSSLKILDCTLYYDKVFVSPDLAISHNVILNQGQNALYNFKRCEVRNFLISQGSSSFAWDNVTTGILPSFVILAFVETDAYNGSVLKNPYKFETCSISDINASVSGISVAPRHLNLNFEQKNPLSQHAYFSLFKQLNLNRFDRANLIDYDLYNNGAFMLAYNLTTDRGSDEFCSGYGATGNLRFEGKFARPLPASITALAYLQYDADLIVDKDRNIYPANY